MQTKNILSYRLTVPRIQIPVRQKGPEQSIKVVMVRGCPITLKWVKSLQCWCKDPSGLLKARREKAKIAFGSPWRVAPVRFQSRRPEIKRAVGA